VAGTTRLERIADHERNAKWKNAPVRIEMSECINCDACLRHCPPQFGAIFNQCLPACPVDCIYPDPEWNPAPDAWWELPLSRLDPYK
jgi:electron transport complex protein RnfB